MRRADVEAIAEDWAARASDRTAEDWLNRFLVSLGGEVRPSTDANPSTDPNALLLVAARIDCFITSGANVWALSEALGHLVLHLGHCDTPDDQPLTMAIPAIITPRGPYARARLEAVWFALTFITPAPRFRDAWQRHGGNLRRIGAELGIPVTMIATRAINLGLS